MIVRLVFCVLLLFTTRIAAFVPYQREDQYNPRLFTPRSRSRKSFRSTNSLEPSTRTSKKKKIRSKKKNEASRGAKTWRVFGVLVHPDDLVIEDPKVLRDHKVGKRYLSPPVLKALYGRLKVPEKDIIDENMPSAFADVRVVRRSLDARKMRRSKVDPSDTGPRYNYVLDVDILPNAAKSLRLKHQPGRCEQLGNSSFIRGSIPVDNKATLGSSDEKQRQPKPKVIIVGAGPAGLFCALSLARSGRVTPVILERGQAVESRGKDIGALMHRKTLNRESNFCFGEGGAGTWSDGKLTTRIGRNSEAVRFVLETLVAYGAPESILVDGAPHLGTDNLVRLLRNMRANLRELGGEIRFGSKVTGFAVEKSKIQGVHMQVSEAMERGTHRAKETVMGSQTIYGDSVVLATGHSARDIYFELQRAGVQLKAKGFAAGFRVEHPQSYITKIQYGAEWGPSVITGKKATDDENQKRFAQEEGKLQQHTGRLPVPSYRLATDKAFDGKGQRGVYSFCMCPGGQVVPSSTDPEEICVNGMSFSRRDSLWANSALVVTINPEDDILDGYREKHGVLAGLAFQKDMERKAAKMGGGNMTVPVQRMTDFVKGVPSTSNPPSSYRLGVKPSALHEIYPAPIVEALRDAMVNHFNKKMPGYVSDEGLLHGVETRTSSPVRISRDPETFEAMGTAGLFPAGEGAGFAGGIVSAAVDGMVVAESILNSLGGDESTSNVWKGSASVGFKY